MMETTGVNRSAKIPVGISQCLLGAPVRYNAGHKHSVYCTQTLGEYFEFKGICPEVGIGLSTPRETIRLISSDIRTVDTPHLKRGHVREANDIRLVNSSNQAIDHTDTMRAYAKREGSLLGHLRGYIFMKNSPTCGLFRVKVYNDAGYPEAVSQGIYADEITTMWPNLPVEEEGRLNDPLIKEHFMTQVLAYDDWKNTTEKEAYRFADLLQFHSRYKYLLLAYDPNTYKSLGQLLAQGKTQALDTLSDVYETTFMQAIKQPAKRQSHVNVLLHLQGHFKKKINSQERQAIRSLIEKYSQGIVPLIVPMTMLRHYLEQYPEPFAVNQVYLHPHPEILGLHNAI